MPLLPRITTVLVFNNYTDSGSEGAVHDEGKGKYDKGKGEGKNAKPNRPQGCGVLAKGKFAREESPASSLGPTVTQFPYPLFSWPKLPLIRNQNRCLRDRC
jgi:hypothetical protein